MIVGALFLGLYGLILTGAGCRSLLWLHKMRKVSDVTGTVVARERHFTGKSFWTFPVVEFTTRDGIQIRRMFRQVARPTIGRKLRIVYDPSTLPDGRKRSAIGAFTLVSRAPMIYSAWLLTWLWLLTAAGLACLVLCIGLASGAAG